jgi:DNA polymerase II small subunit/DNA polymerase delta subunit B
MYDGLEAELSARKEDSEVLIKVADIVRDDTIGCSRALGMIGSLLTDYLGAPEVPKDTSIDEPQEITVTVALLELP